MLEYPPPVCFHARFGHPSIPYSLDVFPFSDGETCQEKTSDYVSYNETKCKLKYFLQFFFS